MLAKVIWAASGLLVVAWIIGVVFEIAEEAIHLLLLVAAALGIVNLVRMFGKRGPATE